MAKSILPNPTCPAVFLTAAYSFASCFVVTCHATLTSSVPLLKGRVAFVSPMVSSVSMCYSQGWPIASPSLHSHLLYIHIWISWLEPHSFACPIHCEYFIWPVCSAVLCSTKRCSTHFTFLASSHSSYWLSPTSLHLLTDSTVPYFSDRKASDRVIASMSAVPPSTGSSLFFFPAFTFCPVFNSRNC